MHSHRFSQAVRLANGTPTEDDLQPLLDCLQQRALFAEGVKTATGWISVNEGYSFTSTHRRAAGAFV
jgi:hypothetical protein